MATQAKTYNPATTVTKRDVDTFPTESMRSEFSFRLFIATTNRVLHGTQCERSWSVRKDGRLGTMIVIIKAATGFFAR
ncbi:hypothetical protein [Nocardia sp. NPDC052112]|uniref:restriction endonuclease n=1 Tax=Nocardia sp. NPDC052112 TaxID=3155646 RepID=UPI003419F6B3